MVEQYKLTGKVRSVENISGTSKKGPWDKATLKIEKDGATKSVGTFDTNDIEVANKANGKTVEVIYVKNGDFNNLVKEGIKIVADEPEQELIEEPIGEEPSKTDPIPPGTPIQDHGKDMAKVEKFKTAESDKYMLGMAINNAATLLSNSGNAIYIDGSSNPDLKVYWELAEKLYLEGREFRKKHLGI